MELSKSNIFDILSEKKYVHHNINKFIIETKDLYFKFLDIFFSNEINGLENIEQCNPLLWEAYHPIWFMRKLCLSYFYEKLDLNYENLIYDSHKCKRAHRFNQVLYSKKEIIDLFEDSINKLNKIPTNATNHYLILLSILHLHMHLESYLFTRKVMLKDYCKFSIIKYESTIEELEFVKIPGGIFKQGSEKSFPICFDNELPRFTNYVNDFYISKTVVTNNIYYKFILQNGYQNEKYWSHYGWKYIIDNKIKLPKYWKKVNNTIEIYFNSKWVCIDEILNYPVCHISWWEAEAFCKWYGGRMILEKEWEYTTTFCDPSISNINYENGILPVNHPAYTKNKIWQMFGNVWEWCYDFIYPYDGYVIDPVYREYSYPFFGFKKIVKGSSWTTPKLLNYSSYRNAQMPDCRYQYISFRVVKDINSD